MGPLCIGWLIFKWSFEYTPAFIIRNNNVKNVKISQSRLNIFYIFVGSKTNRFFNLFIDQIRDCFDQYIYINYWLCVLQTQVLCNKITH